MRLALLLWGGAGLVLLVVVGWLLWPRATRVETARVDRGEVSRTIFEDARLEVRDLYEISAPVGGRLERIELEPGDHVARGQALFHISALYPTLIDARAIAVMQAEVLAAEQSVAVATADLELSQKQLDRTNRLGNAGFASTAAMERARSAADGALARLRKAKADLQRTRAAGSRKTGGAQAHTARSPIEGVVLRVLRESEADVLAGAAILEIGDPERIQIVAEYLSSDAALMKHGQVAVIHGLGESPVEGRVRLVEPFARTKVSALGVEEQRVRVVIDIDAGAASATLGHGYQVDAGVVTFRADNVLRVPTDALVRHNGGWAVMRVRDGRALLSEVTLGDGDDQFRQVLGGIAEKDQVVLFPGDTIRNDDRVEASS